MTKASWMRTTFKYTVRTGPFVHEGNNQKDCIDRALAQAHQALSGSFYPILVQWKGLIGLVWKNPYGWNYSILTEAIDSRKTFKTLSGVLMDVSTENEARLELFYKLILDAWKPGDEMPEEFYYELFYRREAYLQWTAWQEKYHEAKQRGFSDAWARGIADKFFVGLSKDGLTSEQLEFIQTLYEK